MVDALSFESVTDEEERKRSILSNNFTFLHIFTDIS